jgi:hypothetical protein
MSGISITVMSIRRAALALGLAATSAAVCAACSQADSSAPPPSPQASPPPDQPRAPGSATSLQGNPNDLPVDEMLHGLPGATAAYSYLLGAIVSNDGLVRFHHIASQEMLKELLESTVRLHGEADLPEVRAERLAFWINAYNANVLAMTLAEMQKPGFSTVIEVRGFFDERLITVAGESMTLNDLQNKKIRPMGDPRIHAALVCSAVSCPPLRAEPYVAARLDRQLDDQARRWVNDAARNVVTNQGLALSMIFDWYKDDFAIRPFGDRIGFVLRYAEPGGPIEQYLKSTRQPVILWQPYDWTLNAAPIPSKNNQGHANDQ